MDKKKFARLHWPISIKLDELGKEYQEVSLMPLKNEEDVVRMRNEFVRVANKFIDLKDEANSISAPEGYEKEVDKMRGLFSNFVSAIKEQSEGFGIVKEDELNKLIAAKEVAGKLHRDYMYELTNIMFPQ